MPIILHQDIPIGAVACFVQDNDYDVVDHGNGTIEIVVKKDDPLTDFKIKRQAE